MPSYLSKVADFNLPHLLLVLPVGTTLFEFCQDLWRQKNRVSELSIGIDCVILSLATLIKYWHVSDRQTDRETQTHRQTDRHTL